MQTILARCTLALGALLLLPIVACGGSDRSDNKTNDSAAEQVRLLADKAEADALTAKAFRRTGYLSVCRQATGYAGTVFEQVGFIPTGDAFKDEYCYNVADDLAAVGLSVRSSENGEGLCIVSRIEGGKITRTEARALGSSEACNPR
ncbi:MAG: hypothetical protein ABI782_08370 [Anaerolineaceae bacterium]